MKDFDCTRNIIEGGTGIAFRPVKFKLGSV